MKINRELSWLDFNQRVLFQANDTSTPLLEKLFFLGVYQSNLDEFFMIRVGGLSDKLLLKIDDLKKTSHEIQDIFSWLIRHQEQSGQIYRNVLNELSKEGIGLYSFSQFDKEKIGLIKKEFNHTIGLYLSPQIIDQRHPIPFLENLKEYIFVRMMNKNKEVKYGIIPLHRVNPLFSYGQQYFLTEEVIKHFCPSIFKKFTILQTVTVRITRNADLDLSLLEKNQQLDYVSSMSSLLKKRRKQNIVRVQLSNPIESDFRNDLVKQLKINKDYFIVENLPLSFGFADKLRKIYQSDNPLWLYPKVVPINQVDFTQQSAFDYLLHKDLLNFYPYHSSSALLQLIYQAANDPGVMSIKVCLYRLASPSRIAESLMHAAEKGKEVVCVLELRARFDEQSNIDYSQMLINAGCRVLYGLPDYKVHSKLCLITRKVNDQIQKFSYIGTGNFNEFTQQHYTDIGLMTSNMIIGEDVSQIFDSLALNELSPSPQLLWVAPNDYKSMVIKEIQKQIELKENGLIQIKCNSINDETIIDWLILASENKVKVDLIVRGICCLIPTNSNLRVKSILGRHLEHSRIFRFGQENPTIYIGSGDLLLRNTLHRVEVFAPILDESNKEQILHLLQTELAENSDGWWMNEHGDYEKFESEIVYHSQEYLRTYFQDTSRYQFVIEKKRGLWNWLKRIFKR